ncbi:hypothetical protein BKA82DRAFT_4019967 [Pisolithus tinctorius]|nr:hypothetical protein BKA82DRAFT_4019967 [Pisolithus tinctorius]
MYEEKALTLPAEMKVNIAVVNLFAMPWKRLAQKYKFSQSTDKSLSNEMPAVRRSRSRRPMTKPLQGKDTYLTVDRSKFIDQQIAKQLAKGDTISVLDTVQRHHDAPFYLGDIIEDQDMLDILRRSGIQVPYLEKSFNMCDDAQGTFRSRDSQVISDNNRDRLIPPPSYSPTTSSEPELDLESAMAVFIESLHCALPPICATTEYHCMTHGSVQLLGPHVTSPPNTESILSAFSTPFDPFEGHMFFIMGGGPFCSLGFTRGYRICMNNCRRPQEYEWWCYGLPAIDGHLKQQQRKIAYLWQSMKTYKTGWWTVNAI